MRDENPSPDSGIASEERPTHSHLEQMQMILYTRPSGIACCRKTGWHGAKRVRKALVTVERHIPPEWELVKKHLRPPAIPDRQADDPEDMGILVDEVYDERIIEDSLHQAENPSNE